MDNICTKPTQVNASELDFTESDKDCRPPLNPASQEEKQPYFLRFDDLRDSFKPEWLVKGILPVAGIGAIYGEPASGKSFLMIDLALAILRGKNWFGYKTKQRPVIYICLEGKIGFIGRLLAWEESNDEKIPNDLALKFSDFTLSKLPDQDVQQFPKYSLLIIDTLNAVEPGLDENSSTGMGLILEKVRKIQEITGGFVLLVHHCGKDGSKGLRGHSSLFAALDIAIQVTGSNGTRTWKIAKNKDGESGISGNFALRQIQLGIDEDGDPITSCVVEPCEQPQHKTTLPAALNAAYTILLQLCHEAGTNEIETVKWRKIVVEKLSWKKDRARAYFADRRKRLIEMGFIEEKQGMTRVLRQV